MKFQGKSKLAKLNEKDITEIMNLYYESDYTVKEIIELFSIFSIHESELYKQFPLIEHKDQTCDICNSFMYERRKAKTSYSKASGALFCLECGHENKDWCTCPTCEKDKMNAERVEQQKKRDFILSKLLCNEPEPVSFKDLTYKEKLYLGSLMRGGMKSNYEGILPIEVFPNRLSPHVDYDHEIFKTLYEKNIIKIDLCASLDCFDVDYEQDSCTFFWRKVPFKINVEELQNDNLINHLVYPSLIDFSCIDSILKFWKEIQYWEVIELFEYRMDAYGFNYTVGKETKAFFNMALEELSVAELYPIIWSSAKGSAAYYQEGKVNKKQAANSTLGRMRNAFDRIKSGQWVSSRYNRPKDCPQSNASEYIFNSLFNIFEKNWEIIPTANAVKKLLKPEN